MVQGVNVGREETPEAWCERTWVQRWDDPPDDRVTRWELQRRPNKWGKWNGCETIERAHCQNSRDLLDKLLTAAANTAADDGARFRVLAWRPGQRRRQVSTKTLPLGDMGDEGGEGTGLDGVEPNVWGLLRYVLGLTLTGRDVGTAMMLSTIEAQSKELRELRSWRWEAIALVEDLHDNKASRELRAKTEDRRGQLVQSVVNAGMSKLLAHDKGDRAAQVETLLGSALAEFGASLSPEQIASIAGTLAPEQQLAFYLAVLPEDGGHERLRQLQEAKQRQRPSPEMLTQARENLGQDDYAQLLGLLQRAQGKGDDQSKGE